MFELFKRRSKKTDPAAGWRAAWAEAIDRPSPGDIDRLRTGLEGLRRVAQDLEIELEMLEAVEVLRALESDLASAGLPRVETQHRVVGADPCHFSAPASIAAGDAQDSGRVLFTETRAIFVGSGRTSVTPWHTVQDALRSDRDLMLLRRDDSPAAHYRFNTFADALSAALLARHLGKGRTPRL